MKATTMKPIGKAQHARTAKVDDVADGKLPAQQAVVHTEAVAPPQTRDGAPVAGDVVKHLGARGPVERRRTAGMTRVDKGASMTDEGLALAARLGFGAAAPDMKGAYTKRLIARFGDDVLRPPGVEVLAFERGAVFREKGGAVWRPVPAPIPPGTKLGVDAPGYDPVAYAGAEVLAEADKAARGEKTWAHKEGLDRAELDGRVQTMKSHAGPIRTDPSTGLPLNPAGPTGVCGRGESNLGPIRAQDLLVTSKDPQTGKTFAILIQRKDTGRWAMPGGIEDDKDKGAKIPAAVREFFEEAIGKKPDEVPELMQALTDAFGSARQVYQGVCTKEPRNTDNMWFETTVFRVELPWSTVQSIRLDGSDDAKKAKLLELTPKRIAAMHGDHPDFVRLALQ